MVECSLDGVENSMRGKHTLIRKFVLFPYHCPLIGFVMACITSVSSVVHFISKGFCHSSSPSFPAEQRCQVDS